MQPSVDQHWNTAQRLEQAGDFAAAIAEYEALLQQDARHAPAHLRLSRHAEREGRYRRARHHALQAADAIRSGASLRNIAYVTLRLLDFSEDAEIASVVLSADWKHPHVLQASPSLAQHLWLAGRFEDAHRFLDSVEPSLPAPDALLRFTRANLLRFEGNIGAAIDVMEQAIALRPGFADAHFALATMAHTAGAAQRVQRIAAASLRADPAQAVDRAQLAYARFHELDRLDEREAAWEALDDGARSMREMSFAHAALALERTEALVDAAPTMPIEQGAPLEVQPRPVFVLGLPRTGTTLLDRILGNHGWITSVGESNALFAAVSEASDRFYGGLAEAGAGTLTDLDLAQVGHGYLQRLRQAAPSTALALDKNPRNLFEIPLILAALPSARILVLEREPMDAAFSNFKALLQGRAYAYGYDFAQLARHVAATLRWTRFWASAHPETVRVVRYETLVEDPDAEADALMRFLDVPHQEGLSDLTRNRTPVATASSAQVRGEVHAGAIGAWRRYEVPLEPLRRLIEGYVASE